MEAGDALDVLEGREYLLGVGINVQETVVAQHVEKTVDGLKNKGRKRGSEYLI